MRSIRWRLGVGATFVVVAALTGAGYASSGPEVCNPEGRALCITITDTDRVSPSNAGTPRHMSYSVRVRNGGRAAITNVSARIELVADVVAGSEQPTDAAFLSSFVPAGCTLEGPAAIECSLEDLAAGESVVLDSIVARTSRTSGATATRTDVTARGDEGRQDRPAPDPQPDTFTVTEFTSYELDGDRSATVVYDGGSAVLATDPGDGQFTSFNVPVPSGFSGAVYSFLEEFSPGEEGHFCPTGTDCWGQSMSISASGVFSALNLAEVVTTADLRTVPGGISPRNVGAYHRYDDGTVAHITARCSTAFGVLPPASEVPCLNAAINRGARVMVIRVVDAAQGQWGFN